MRHASVALAPLALLTASAAQAAPASEPAGPARSPLRPIVAFKLPARCQPLTRIPHSTQILNPDFAAHISITNCLAEVQLSQVEVQPDHASIATLELITEPSIAILDDVIAHDDAFDRWLNAHPGTDSQQLRALIRQARKDVQPDADSISKGLAPRQGRAYREIFQLVRERLANPTGDIDLP